MAFTILDRVQETTTTVGTSDFALGGAVTGYQSFSAIGNGNTTYYAVWLPGTNEWEVGIGTYSSTGPTLSRTTILASSNSGSIVTFSAGLKNIWSDYPAGKAIFTDPNGSISEPIVDISNVSGAITTPESITFDVNPAAIPTAPGSLYWDSADGNQTLSLVMANGDAIQQIGEEQYYRIKASAAITEGQVVMFTGTVGASGALTGAPATGLTASTASYVMGIATQNIALNGWGYITSFGLVRNINTVAFNAGDILYYDPTSAGGLTTTIPSAPNAKVQVCAVIYSHVSNGSVFVRPSFGGVLGQYEGDVDVTSPANGDLLIRNQTSGKWVNAPLTAGTGISVTNAAGSVTVTNSAPDQTVAITAGTGISVTGTYPNFTVTNTEPSSGGTVTSVTGTAPIASSGGTTPDISISQAGTSTDGYLSSTDWNTFNNKQPAGSYLTSVTADSPLTGSGTSASHLSIPAATTSADGYLTSTDWNTFNNKQDLLVSGTNIKTINSTSILGSGNLSVSATPAGSDTQVQYNNSGALGASSAFTYASSALTAPNLVASNGLVSNNNTVSASFTVPSGSSVMSVGPITVASGQSVTVPSGGRWVVL